MCDICAILSVNISYALNSYETLITPSSIAWLYLKINGKIPSNSLTQRSSQKSISLTHRPDNLMATTLFQLRRSRLSILLLVRLLQIISVIFTCTSDGSRYQEYHCSSPEFIIFRFKCVDILTRNVVFKPMVACNFVCKVIVLSGNVSLACNSIFHWLPFASISHSCLLCTMYE